jgi:hypothetical protein
MLHAAKRQYPRAFQAIYWPQGAIEWVSQQGAIPLNQLKLMFNVATVVVLVD